MPEGSFLYCDVSLPVPLDQPFTYSLPQTLQHRVKPGSRIVVPFGPRKLTGVILRCHDEDPAWPAQSAAPDRYRAGAERRTDRAGPLDLRLLLRAAGRSAARCCRSPPISAGQDLVADRRRARRFETTSARRRAGRPGRSNPRHARRAPALGRVPGEEDAARGQAVRSLERKGWIAAEQVQKDRDPLRAPSRAAAHRAQPPADRRAKLERPNANCCAFLALHPGSHNLGELEDMVTTRARPRARWRAGDWSR